MFGFQKTATSDLKPTVVENVYGGVSVIPPERPTPVYERPVQLTAQDVCQMFGWATTECIDDAQSIGFPRAVAFQTTRHLGGVQRTPLYEREHVVAWRAKVKRLANL